MTATATPEHWQSLFENWPDAIERKGAIVTPNGELIPFVGFLISFGLLLLERDGPDANGTRKIIISYDAISMIKLKAVGEMSRFQSMGFQPPM
ncbi:MAG: hypothetical protein ACI87E_000872 [Mariniblastus sp.]|jgi:hypothetical protein